MKCARWYVDSQMCSLLMSVALFALNPEINFSDFLSAVSLTDSSAFSSELWSTRRKRKKKLFVSQRTFFTSNYRAIMSRGQDWGAALTSRPVKQVTSSNVARPEVPSRISPISGRNLSLIHYHKSFTALLRRPRTKGEAERWKVFISSSFRVSSCFCFGVAPRRQRCRSYLALACKLHDISSSYLYLDWFCELSFYPIEAPRPSPAKVRGGDLKI